MVYFVTDWFVNVFLPASKSRLREAHAFFTEKLLEIGVPCHKGAGGLYVWADFSKVSLDRVNKSSQRL